MVFLLPTSTTPTPFMLLRYLGLSPFGVATMPLSCIDIDGLKSFIVFSVPPGYVVLSMSHNKSLIVLNFTPCSL